MNSGFLDTWRWVFTRLDRSIERAVTGSETVTFTWLDPDKAPGNALSWSSVEERIIGVRADFVEAWFNTIPGDEATQRMLGVNLQEVARMIFAPRRELVDKTELTFLDASYTEETAAEILERSDLAYSILEDQRIQRRLVEIYPEAAAPLSSVALAFFTHYMGDLADQAKIVRGLAGVPADMRSVIDLAYAERYGNQASERLSQIVFEYVDLRPEKDLERMWELAVQLTHLEAPETFPSPDLP